MNSYVVDYKRLKRVSISDTENKINLNHWCYAAIALLFMFIYKRVKDKQSYQQL